LSISKKPPRLARRLLALSVAAALHLALLDERAHAAAPEESRGLIGATIVLTTEPSAGSLSTVHVSPTISAEYRITPAVSISLDGGASYTRYSRGGERGERGDSANSYFGPGNALLAGHYTFLEARGVTLRSGLGLGVPMAFRAGNLSERVAADFGLATASQARGLTEPWLWTLNTVSIVTRFSGRIQMASGPVFGGDLALGVMFPISDPIDKTKAALAIGVEGGYALGPVTPGLRIQMASSSRSIGPDDFAQLSIEPLLRGELGRGFARLGFLLNLEGPSGVFGGSEAAFYGLSVGGGYRF
jgi:hypothetical protein